MRGRACYMPKHQTLVFQGNSKDWGYDRSGLLKDIYKNYANLFSYSPLRRSLAEIMFTMQQPSRLPFRRYAIEAFFDLLLAHEPHVITKLALPLVYFIVITIRLKNTAVRVLRWHWQKK